MPEQRVRFFLERPRVDKLLEAAVEYPVVLVTAGEGSGKTAAVHSFLRKRNDTVVWIPLSEHDNDPWHFWESVIAAEGNFNPRAGKAMKETGFPETREQISRYQKIAEEAVPRGRKHIVVVENCHLVDGEHILTFIKQFLAFSIPLKSLILTSRTEPEINVISFFAKGLLFRITAADLRFTEEETGRYFRLQNIGVRGEETKMIFSDTEGWIQAICLIAEEMKREKIPYSRSLRESGILRTLEENLFASVSASLRRFLVILSLFDHWPLEAMEKISAALAKDSAADGSDTLSPLEELSGKTDIVSSLVSYDTYLSGFRIHRSFLDFLREKQKSLSGEEIKTARSIIAQWCKENKLYIYAAINYGRIGDYSELLKTIYSFPRLMSRAAAASLLDIIDRVLETGGRDKEDGNFLFLRHVTRAGILTNLGRYDESRAALKSSIRQFEAMPPGRVSSWILSACYGSLASLLFIGCRRTGEIENAAEYFQRGNYYYMRYPYPVSGPGTKASVGSYMISIGHPPKEGEYETFIDTMSRSIPHAAHSIGGYLSGADRLCKAELAFFKGDLNNAECHAREAVFRAREKAQYEIESKSLFYLYRIHLHNGNAFACRETWEQIENQLNIQDYFNRYAIYDITAGWFYAHSGRTEKIASWLRNESEESELNLSFHNFETMVKAKCLFAEKKYPEALEFLERKDSGEGLESFHLGLLETTVLKAVLRGRAGDEAGAIETLETAYGISAPNSLVMPFIELGEDMKNLAGTVLARQSAGKNRVIPALWLETIRNRASVYAKKLNAVVEQLRSGGGARVPFFTAQELSILEGISRGLTREEIARNESLPVNSVKTAIKTIYGKLDACNRADATRIATGMGLLDGRNM